MTDVFKYKYITEEEKAAYATASAQHRQALDAYEAAYEANEAALSVYNQATEKAMKAAARDVLADTFNALINAEIALDAFAVKGE